MLFGLTALNAAMVILTLSRFSALFFVTNGLNVILAVGLLGDKSWARILTLIRTAFGIALALPVLSPGQQGAPLDFLVTVLLLGGVFVTLIGPPNILKTAVGVTMFVIGIAGTLLALLVLPVTTG